MLDTSSGQSDLHQGFIRQRRNLIVISLILIFVQISGLTFEKISVFGTVAHLEHSSVVDIALWIGWGYWLLRYWQFFHDLRDRGIAKSYTDRLENLVPSAILKRLDKTGQLDTYAPDIDPKSRIYTLTGVGNTVSPYTASLTIKIESADGNSHLVTAIGEHTIPLSQVPLERLQALFHVTVRTRLGTEFILPFVIASVPLIVLVYMHWPRN